MLNVLWLAFVSVWVLEEASLGLFAAAVWATAAEAVREQGVAGFQLRVRWLGRYACCRRRRSGRAAWC